MTRIVCLANSWKHKERCIAGIDPATGRWIRPVTDLDDGRVPRQVRLIRGREPALLDILDIPLAASGPHADFERENRLILPGAWRCLGRARLADLFHYCDTGRHILHNGCGFVTVPFLRSLPAGRRRILQLIRTDSFAVQPKGRREWGGNTWEGSLGTPNGRRLRATITDPVFVTRLELGYRPGPDCLVTVSIGMPYPPGGDQCWKLIAAVIDLANERVTAGMPLGDELEEVPF